MATKKKLTANAGAAIERKKLLAKLTRMRLTGVADQGWPGYNQALTEVAAWVRGSAPRASAKTGGLGRK
jgi:hypothetical protein